MLRINIESVDLSKFKTDRKILEIDGDIVATKVVVIDGDPILISYSSRYKKIIISGLEDDWCLSGYPLDIMSEIQSSAMELKRMVEGLSNESGC